jgi:hypothetical protein
MKKIKIKMGSCTFLEKSATHFHCKKCEYFKPKMIQNIKNKNENKKDELVAHFSLKSVTHVENRCNLRNI